ncbi:MAG TPA: hydantoinase/oxoprolinase family protein [Gaiellaceae bacterium]
MPRLGIDVGGTFVDLVLADDNGGLVFEKVLAEPADLVGSIVSGVRTLLDRAGISGGEIVEAMHATTRGSNTVLERSGPRTALVVTRGFKDVLQIQRALRWSMYDVQLDKPEPLVPRSLSFEVTERMLADGSVHVPLVEDEVYEVAEHIRVAGVEAVAVAFLHSYAGPEHERRAASILAAELPGIVVTASSDVSLQAREYERANTAVVNSYIARAVSEYMTLLVETLPRVDVGAPVWIMQSSGGLASVEQALERPVRTLESGPAAGVVGAAAFGAAVGFADVISFDMGGTTAKAAVISGGVPATTTYCELQRVESRRGSGLPVDIPALDLVEVGTGGGSIAEVREGTLRVGPRSAGANPGPACYGRGGTAPTVTDANLLLGYYDPAVFAGGVVLDVGAAEAAVDALAATLGIDRIHAAWGIHEVATLDMENAIRLVSINRGFDPREHALVCTGGAGPAHGPRLARALGAKVAVIPRAASGGSARGLLEATASTEVTRTALVRLDAEDAAKRCGELIAEVVEEAERGSFGTGSGSELRLTVGMRYLGQGYELLVPVDAGLRDPRALAEEFHRRYERAYGYRDEQPVEVVTWHVALVRARRAHGRANPRPDRATPGHARRRAAYFPESGLVEVEVHDRMELREGDVLRGPCLVAETTTTTVVLPGDRVEVAADGSLLVHIGAPT